MNASVRLFGILTKSFDINLFQKTRKIIIVSKDFFRMFELKL
jgi:hypothetical protein